MLLMLLYNNTIKVLCTHPIIGFSFTLNMAAIPIENRIFIVKTFYQNSSSATIVKRKYAKEFGNKDIPAESTHSR